MVADLTETLRKLLKLPAGVIMTDDEMDRAVERAPQAERDALRSAIIQYKAARDIAAEKRAKERGPRGFGGLR